MEPLFFGPADHSLFGWLHLPAGRAPRRTAVVLCPPFGQEFVLAHRAATRDHFARGAVAAAAWLVGRPPGHYRVEQVLGLEPSS